MNVLLQEYIQKRGKISLKLYKHLGFDALVE